MVEDVFGGRDRSFDALLATGARVLMRIPTIPELGGCAKHA